MLKKARLSDSEKAELVDKKRILNENVSRSADKLFAAKDAWNGKPAPEIGLPIPHSINEPIPQEVLSTMDEVMSVLNESHKILKEIANQQEGQYKQKVQKKKEHVLDLSALASNELTRFVSHIKAPFQGDSEKWIRLKLLRGSAALYKMLEKIDYFVLTDAPTAIPNAVYKAKDLYYIFDSEVIDFLKNKNTEEENGVTQPDVEDYTTFNENPERETAETEKSPEVQSPYEYIEMEYSLRVIRAELEALKRRLPADTFKPFSPEYKDLVRKVQYISELLKHDYTRAEQEHQNLLQEIVNFRAKIDNISSTFKTANKFVNFLKRKNVQYLTLPSNNQKAIRLKVDKEINETMHSLDIFMNALENSSISPKSLGGLVSDVCKNLAKTLETLIKLGEIHNSDVKRLKHKSKEKKIDIDSDLISNIDLRSLFQMSKKLHEASARLQAGD